MKLNNVYFFNGTAYAGKSTMVKRFAEKYGGIACEENCHEALMGSLGREEFTNLTYTQNLTDWADFIRRTPDEYEKWVDGVSAECEILELRILEDLVPKTDKRIFVDTNISLDTLKRISDREHVVIMLAAPGISVSRFFDRPDREKQFLYRLLMAEANPDAALDNFRQCLSRINSAKRYNEFANSGFNVVYRDERRSIEDTMKLIEGFLRL